MGVNEMSNLTKFDKNQYGLVELMIKDKGQDICKHGNGET